MSLALCREWSGAICGEGMAGSLGMGAGERSAVILHEFYGLPSYVPFVKVSVS